MAEYFFGMTDKGRRREKNEDTFFVREIINKRFLVACVIDGVGGYKGGDIAAAIARSVIMKKLETISEDVIETLQQAIVAANTKINQQKKPGAKNERMACVLTCAVVDIKNSKCWYAHVGDTRIYLLRDRSLIKISRDHSAVGFLEESGRLSEEEAMRHPRRNEINKALGFEEDITTAEDFIETGESPFLSGDLLLLCSDGLTDMISSATIISVLTTEKSLAAKAKALIDAANDAGGNDNITAVLVENNKEPKLKPEPVRVERKKELITSPLSADELLPKKDKISSKKSRGSRLVLLTLLFIAIVGVALMAAYKKSMVPKAVMPATVAPKKNEVLNQLMVQINDSTKTVVLPAEGTVLEIAAPVTISKDSFYLKGNGSILMADSAFKGPALIINASAKHIVLDSLVFKNFDVGLMLQKNNVVLKNVRFVNCRIPVQYAVFFADSLVSGKFKDSIFITHSNTK
ncbi:protein phosphatase 2C domain-containing protein [Ferruginibacter paludis]|uniref:PP2C family protein-serine/threonine phosphatase n=1 Tax=Ferruginibacter paludis TaxID=1310417 RepID=UPI0025B3418E|nr:protein phosphatase 2C domain-containing protein [Ferruginibacter paludis]MDN3657121.1 protein phosphatase 2C domain-containing protein [Ferruginibacter paludis]